MIECADSVELHRGTGHYRVPTVEDQVRAGVFHGRADELGHADVAVQVGDHHPGDRLVLLLRLGRLAVAGLSFARLAFSLLAFPGLTLFGLTLAGLAVLRCATGRRGRGSRRGRSLPGS